MIYIGQTAIINMAPLTYDQVTPREKCV